MIKHVSLPHGWYYFYRIDEDKLEALPRGYRKLAEYMDLVFSDCPHDHFSSGPRSSHLKMDVGADLVEMAGHEVCSWAKHGLLDGRYKTAHSKVEVSMLENDPKTFAVEVPVWLLSSELELYEDIFGSKQPLSGHIDLLRFEDGKIWIWDFKPKADKERYASTQLFFYALMLSKRTGIPLDDFMCGYFDQHTSFAFKPKMGLFKKNLSRPAYKKII